MTRDYSDFFPPQAATLRSPSVIEQYGWEPFFAQQISVDDLSATPPARVVEVHRNGLHIIGDELDITIPPLPDATVGDWVLYDQSRPNACRVLTRKSVVKRRAAGTGRQIQLIAASSTRRLS
ncbi:ribosome small subunit-dependent GTPase A [Litoreibacter albidus]|uniref:hypothetical protein n=1 Tax=Litoreibacter albidus TaxID=670155 RepID=UPI003736FBA5